MQTETSKTLETAVHRRSVLACKREELGAVLDRARGIYERSCEARDRAAAANDAAGVDQAIATAQALRDANDRASAAQRRLHAAQADYDGISEKLERAQHEATQAAKQHLALVEFGKLVARFHELDAERQAVKERLYGLHLAIPDMCDGRALFDIEHANTITAAHCAIGLPVIAVGPEDVYRDPRPMRARVERYRDEWQLRLADMERNCNHAAPPCRTPEAA